MSTRVRLGKSELSVSPVCYGTWQFSQKFWGPQPEDQMIAALRHAFDLGVNFYDTANSYGDGLAEQVMGKALADLPRRELVIATKIYWHFFPDRDLRYPDLTREHVLEGCDASLKRLGMDYVDLYQLHSFDALADPAGTFDALDTLRKQGKIRAYGVSNWTAQQMAMGHAIGGDFVTHQPPYNLIQRDIENDQLPYCLAHDIGVLVFSPLHLGLLSGKYTGRETFEDIRSNHPKFQGERFKTICERVAQVGDIASGYGMSTVQLVLAVTLMHPAVHCTIVGIKRPDQIEDAAGAMGRSVSHADGHRVRDLLRV